MKRKLKITITAENQDVAVRSLVVLGGVWTLNSEVIPEIGDTLYIGANQWIGIKPQKGVEYIEIDPTKLYLFE